MMVILDLRTPQFLSPKKYNKHFHKGVLQKEVKNITCIFNKNRITHLWLGEKQNTFWKSTQFIVFQNTNMSYLWYTCSIYIIIPS